MFYLSLKTFSNAFSLSNKVILFRYVRNKAGRKILPQILEGKVKNVNKTLYEPGENIESYKDFVKSVKNSDLGDELEIEKSFIQDDYFGHPIERAEHFYEMHTREEKYYKSEIKKKIIGRKYFKLDRETNLLTCAAKEQIRYLCNSNPHDWNPKAISECFPISEAGVKKLLKSNFTPTDPERIKTHDEDVAEKWRILKSEKVSSIIAPLTQKLYSEGKLVDDYFSGNPNLPIAPQKKVVHIEKPKKIGEFSLIVQSYANYKNQNLLNSSKESTESHLVVKEKNKTQFHTKHKNYNVTKFRPEQEEFDDDRTEVECLKLKKKDLNHMDLPFSQFKEILKEESLNENDTNRAILNEPALKPTATSIDETQADSSCFLTIKKYDRDRNIEVMHDKVKNTKVIYKYDEKLGYQYPIGQNIKRRIKFPQKWNKTGKLYKVDDSVYSENGEFLYKVP